MSISLHALRGAIRLSLKITQSKLPKIHCPHAKRSVTKRRSSNLRLDATVSAKHISRDKNISRDMARTDREVMVALYGRHWDENLTTTTRNIRTKNGADPHHCPVCEASPKMPCLTRFHLAFCIAKVSVQDKEDICGERFAPKSPNGCSTHSYKLGYNEIFKKHKITGIAMADLLAEMDEEPAGAESEHEPEEIVDDPDLGFEHYNEQRKQKELDEKRERHTTSSKKAAAKSVPRSAPKQNTDKTYGKIKKEKKTSAVNAPIND